jgi:tripartite-type tricarboxylate transporter receptor subunit TctC
LNKTVWGEIDMTTRSLLTRRSMLRSSSAAIAATALGRSAHAAAYPDRPVRIIAPFGAGGPSDLLARLLSIKLGEKLGETFIVENRPGAGSNIGTATVARATPDGYTLLIGQWSTQVVNPATYKLDYDVVNEFAPIALLAVTPQIIIARKDFPAKDVHELIAWLKANPDKAQAATVGAAGGAQVAGMYFAQVTGTKFGFVPYRGGAPAMQDLIAGRIDFMFDQAANALTQLRAGTIKAYAVMTDARWHLAPEIPTIDEAGVEGLHISYWHALWAPKAAPEDIIAKVNAAAVQALADPQVQQRFAGQGQDVWPREQQTPRALAAFYKSEIAKWWPIIKAEGLKVE